NNRNLKEIKPGRLLILRILYHVILATWNEDHRLIIKNNKSSWSRAMKQRRSAIFFIFLVISMPLLVLAAMENEKTSRTFPYTHPGNHLVWEEYNDFTPLRSSNITEHPNYTIRKNAFLSAAASSGRFGALSAKIYNNITLTGSNEQTIRNNLWGINERDDCAEFGLNNVLRIMWLGANTTYLSQTIKDEMKSAILGFKYWHTEPGYDDMIFWTENHQIAFHTAELLAGLLYPNETFFHPRSLTNTSWIGPNMTGIDHVNHAVPMILEWLGWKAQLGFTEWHSLTYYSIDVFSLANLIDYSNNTEIVTKASMVLDLLLFDIACNYYKGDFATTHGRAYSRNKVGYDNTPYQRPGLNTVAWLILGLGDDLTGDSGNTGCVYLAQSEVYTPPPILEDIAHNASSFIEHKDRMGIKVEDGPKYGHDYSQEHVHFWWHMSAHVASQVVDSTLAEVEDYNLNTMRLFGPDFIIEVLKVGGFLHGTDASGFAELAKLITQGVAMEEVNTYTYRTSDYQLSGAQDHCKGTNSIQEHVWQASLDRDAIVFTQWPGGVSFFKGDDFTGGWAPRAMFYKNVGVIQHDRESMPLEAEIIFFGLEKYLELFYDFDDAKYDHIYPYIHAYFPQWAFERVEKRGNWLFGKEGNGYIAFYSHEKSEFINDYDYQVKNSRKNVYIVEMGSASEDGSFENFISRISGARLSIRREAIGYGVYYDSPSQGPVTVDWNNPMVVNGNPVDLGPYPRFDNIYCNQPFNTTITEILFENQNLTLDFEAINRSYTS
ncbi:MAG: hypothetical protein ACFFCS_07780, partial [Candidatus Hodarchaeota archaeon]